MAGLVALGVMVVQDAIGSTAGKVETLSARQEAAALAVEQLEERWKAEAPLVAADVDRINRLFQAKCAGLSVLYGDISLEVDAHPGTFKAGGGWDVEPACSLV